MREEDGFDLAQAAKESKTGGLCCPCGPITRSPSLALALGCSRISFPLMGAVILHTLLLKLLLPGQLSAVCPPRPHAKHLMRDLHASLRWPSDKQWGQILDC